MSKPITHTSLKHTGNPSQGRLAKHETMGLKRTRLVIQERSRECLTLASRDASSKTVLSFAQNDYLGLATDPRVIAAFVDGAERYGVGSSSAPTLAGYYAPHQALEEAMAEWLNRERALLFASGYSANSGLFAAKYGRCDRIIADKHCHASLLDGIALSNATLHRYPHQDLAHAETLLQKYPHKKALVSESVFGMTGNVTPIADLVALKNRYQSDLIIDDAHGTGLIDDVKQHSDAIDLLITPLGKIIGGQGAIVSGREEDIELLLQFSRSYLFSTMLPPAMACANLKALRIMQQEPERMAQLLENSRHFETIAEALAIPRLSNDQTPIKAIPLASSEQATRLQASLLSAGFLVAAIRPPTTPTPRLRISLSSGHRPNDIERLIVTLERLL